MLNKYLIKNDQKIAYRVIDEETIIINLEKSTFHSLNPVASLIWQEADGKNQIKTIIQKITNDFDANAETVQKDCIELINDLLNNDLAFLSSNPVEKD